MLIGLFLKLLNIPLRFADPSRGIACGACRTSNFFTNNQIITIMVKDSTLNERATAVEIGGVWATRLKGGSPTQVFGCGDFQKERLRFFGYGNFQRERLKAYDC